MSFGSTDIQYRQLASFNDMFAGMWNESCSIEMSISPILDSSQEMSSRMQDVFWCTNGKIANKNKSILACRKLLCKFGHSVRPASLGIEPHFESTNKFHCFVLLVSNAICIYISG